MGLRGRGAFIIPLRVCCDLNYMIQDPATKAITDFFSFFSTPYSILAPNSGQHRILNIAYLYFYATDVATKGTEEEIRDRLTLLMEDAVYLTKKHEFDVFNALTLMDNPKFMENLKVRVTVFLRLYAIMS